MVTAPDIPLCLKVTVALVQIFTPALAAVVFVGTVMLAACSKQTDVLMECHRRHADVVSKVYELDRGMPDPDLERTDADKYEKDLQKYDLKVVEWFGAFWRQQDDQFVHWQHGFIEDAVYIEWCKARLRAFETAKTGLYLGNMSYHDGYQTVVKHWCSQRFQDFMIALLASGDATATVRSFRPSGVRIFVIRLLCGSETLSSDCVPI